MKARNTVQSTLSHTAPFTSPSVDLANIQGDIIFGLQKKHEFYVFFEIVHAASFRSTLATDIYDIISSSQDVLNFSATIAAHKAQGNTSLLPCVGVNIAVSASGLTQLGLSNNLGDVTTKAAADTTFSAGQLADAANLGDPGTTTDGKFIPAWEPEFLQPIHGVFIVACDTQARAKKSVAEIFQICTVDSVCSIKEITTVKGAVRPGAEKGHEHFGFQDGVSQPAIVGLGTPYAGVQAVDPGFILVGNTSDPHLATRPAWTKDGSFLVFRKLQQLVPEFADFLTSNPLPEDPDPVNGSALLGARIMGRWKSGTSVDMAPTKDDPSIAADPNQVNNFDYKDDPTQERCPFSGHLRKTNPRFGAPINFTPAALAPRRIIRNGIPYGPEVTAEETASKKTSLDRGLAFVCYQSVIANGFQFLQKTWADNPAFPQTGTGFDGIIGQAGTRERTLTGFNPQNTASSLPLPANWVIPKGGEYFFSPSLSAIKSTLGRA